MPTVTLITSEFVKLAEVETRALGMPRLPLVVVPHPVGGIDKEAVRQKAREAFREVRSTLATPARVGA